MIQVIIANIIIEFTYCKYCDACVCERNVVQYVHKEMENSL